MPDTFEMYRRATSLPLGPALFSLLFAQKAPYFWTVRPRVRAMRPHYAEVVIRKRRAILNHIGTVLSIAVCNGLEAAMGLLAEATTPTGHRWIPKGMQVGYVAKANSDLLCTAQTDPNAWDQLGDVPVAVRAIRADGTVVVEGVITIYVSVR